MKNKFINLIQIGNKIGALQLNNVIKKNSLSYSLLKELENVVNEEINKSDLKIIIMESLCENVWSSGHDLEEIYNNLENKEIIKGIVEQCSRTMMSIHKSNKIFIAEISDQLVTAAGLQLAASCDLIMSSTNCKFSIPGSKIGLYAATFAIPLIYNLPKKVLFDMLITSKTFSTEEMLKFGLLNKIVHSEKNENKILIKEKIRNETLNICHLILNNFEFDYDEVIKNLKKVNYKI